MGVTSLPSHQRGTGLISGSVILYILVKNYLPENYSPNVGRVIKSRRIRWTGHITRMEEYSSAFKILIGKSIGNRPLGRPRVRWEDNIRMLLKEIDRYQYEELG